MEKIGIIGGGIAGLSAAWLLRSRYQVVLFERDEQLGGHAQTTLIPVADRTIPVDPATQFFSYPMYPCFVRLLNRLQVPLINSPMTTSIHDAVSGRSLLVTPTRIAGYLRALMQRRAWAYLSQLAYVIKCARKVEQRGDWGLTVGEFVDSIGVTSAFARELFYPVLSGILACPLAEVRSLSARAALQYPMHHRPNQLGQPFMLLEIEGGVMRYVQALAKACGDIQIRQQTAVSRIWKEGNRCLVVDSQGERHDFEHLIIATSAKDALPLVEELPHASLLKAALADFPYSRVVLSIHEDPIGLPAAREAWSFCNYMLDDRRCELTLWIGQHHNMNLFKSRISFSKTPPQKELLSRTYFQPIYTPNYFQAQTRLRTLQGTHGVWFAGSYTQDIDSHEHGLRSAMRIARELASDSNDLKDLESVLSNS